MADGDTTDAPEGTGPPAAEGDRLDKIENKVDRLAELVGKLVPGGNTEPTSAAGGAAPPAADVGSQTQGELAKLREYEAKEAKKKEDEEAKFREEMRTLRDKVNNPPKENVGPIRAAAMRILGVKQ